jgi:hypothetical protein
MTDYSDEYKRSMIAEIREMNKRRYSREAAGDTMQQHSQLQPVIIEDPGLKWRREMTELAAARKQEQKEQSLAEQTHRTVTRMQSEMRQIKSDMIEILPPIPPDNNELVRALKAVNGLAEAICDRIEALENKLDRVEGKGKSSEVIELPNLLKRHGHE